MRYLSVCSGIEAASVAWEPLGWEPVGFCEIEPFPSAVLAHRFPRVPNYGDFTRILTDVDHPVRSERVALLVGGTPCQGFSLAGLRLGLEDPRSNLALAFFQVAALLQPRWILWENVPGVLSQDGGRAFGSILGALDELGFGFAWRILDAQYVRVDGYPRAVPQRRRRVFVVGCAGGDRERAERVLLEPEGVLGDPPPRRKARAGAPGAAEGGAGGAVEVDRGEAFGGNNTAGSLDVSTAMRAKGGSGHGDFESETFVVTDAAAPPGIWEPPDETLSGVAATLKGAGHDASEDGSGRIQLIAEAFVPARSQAPGGRVRRLTPLETERLQGFPEGWTLVPTSRINHKTREMLAYLRRQRPDLDDAALSKLAADGPRYKAVGNSMAVNVMRWIGLRVAAEASEDGPRAVAIRAPPEAFDIDAFLRRLAESVVLE